MFALFQYLSAHEPTAELASQLATAVRLTRSERPRPVRAA
jgi:hypothetical protein